MDNIPIFKFAIREDLKDTGDLFLPQKGEPYSTGWDVKAAPTDRKDIVLQPKQYFRIPLGFRVFPEKHWWFQLHPRSSTFAKKYIHNLIGIIDEHYNNELLIAGQYLPEEEEKMATDYDPIGLPCQRYWRKNILTIRFGEPIAQIIPFKRIEMNINKISNEDFDDLCRKRESFRKGGFGSTDEK